MAANVPERWYFTKEQLKDTPSRRCELDEDKELSYRQQAATLIQDMGQRLSVSQLTINTAIVYMHRFYMFHSFSKVHRNVMAPCCLFLAAKVEEQPRKLEHVIRVAHACLHREGPPLDPKSEEYLQQAQDLVENESVLLQTLGFEVTVHHPHTYVVKCIQLVRDHVHSSTPKPAGTISAGVPTAVSKHASKDLGQTSYFMATNSLHLTTFCLQYKPSTVACACIHLACKWSNWEIPKSTDNKDWWEYIDPSVTKELLDDIAQQFVHIMEKCPNRLKRKVNSVTIYKGGMPLPSMKGHKSELSSSAAANSTSGNVSTTTTVHQNNVDGEHNGTHSNNTAHMNSFDHTVHKEPSSRKEPMREKLKAPTVSLSTNNSGKTSLSVNVSLPFLAPLTTKYANVLSTASASTKEHRATVHLGPPSLSSSGVSSSGAPGKHRHRHPEESPAKKHKSSHSHSSHKSGHRSISASDGTPAAGHSQHSKLSHSSHSSHKSNHSKVPHPHPGQTTHSSSSRSHSHHSHSSQKQPHSSSGHKPHQKHPPLPSADQKAHSSSSSAKKHSSSSSSKLSHLPPPPPPPSSSVPSMAPLPPPPPQTLPSKHDINMGFSSSSIGLQPFHASALSPNMFPPGLLTSQSSGTTQNTYMMSNQFSSSGGDSTLSPHNLSYLFGQQEPPPPPPPRGMRDFPPLPPQSPSPPPPPPPPFPK